MVENEYELALNLKTYFKLYCVRSQIKQKELAQEMGYDETTFSHLLNNRRTIRAADLITFSKYFNEPVETFFKKSLFAEE